MKRGRRSQVFGLLGLMLPLVVLLGACAPTRASNQSDLPPAPPQSTPAARPAQPTATVAAETEDFSLRFSKSGWKTDFRKHSVPLSEIMSGGPPRDGIPPIDQPRFIPFGDADAWLKDNEPVVAFALEGDARAYPLQILIWHEIVNDVVGGVPVAVTFCPLCNTAIAFDRRVEGVGTLRFGTSGNLRHSDLVMWDDQTESWWQQITGEAIVGQLTGTKLEILPASIVSYRDFKATYPDGKVLSRETGHSRAYGANPYVGYDDISDSPFLFTGKPDPRLRPMERVVTVELAEEAVAYPFSLLEQQKVVRDTVGGAPIVVLWAQGTASALDQSAIAKSRDIGATGVFRPMVDGKEITLEWRNDQVMDQETRSTWNVLGHATAGPLEGKRLEPVVHGNHFWFSWAIFKPETRIHTP